MTTTVAEWGTYGGWREKREVASGSHALIVCGEIESHPDAGRVLVGFTAANGHFFAIALGHMRSCVMYWESVDPPYFRSRGPIEQGEALDFAYDGQLTEVPGSALISRDAAMLALTEFIETGARPGGLDWEET